MFFFVVCLEEVEKKIKQDGEKEDEEKKRSSSSMFDSSRTHLVQPDVAPHELRRIEDDHGVVFFASHVAVREARETA